MLFNRKETTCRIRIFGPSDLLSFGLRTRYIASLLACRIASLLVCRIASLLACRIASLLVCHIASLHAALPYDLWGRFSMIMNHIDFVSDLSPPPHSIVGSPLSMNLRHFSVRVGQIKRSSNITSWLTSLECSFNFIF